MTSTRGRGVLPLVLVLTATGLFGQADSRDSQGSFFTPSVGLWGHFDRIHVRDPGAPTPVNAILTCFGWGVYTDWAYGSVRLGLRSQLGTSSLNPGYVDDEQLVATAEVQAKVPVFLGKLVKVFPTLGLEYGTLVSGNLRGDGYYPWLVRMGAGGDLEVTDRVYLRAEASVALARLWVVSVSQSVGVRLP